MNNAAAVILCAGKGTRMNDNSKNKVCFDCAGTPVIKRIIANMRLGGIDKFVIVVGHSAESVMDCLDGEDGVIYVYQKEQKGTGHAALCGLNALSTIGYTGNVVVSMGDKIISSDVIKNLLSKSVDGKSVWSVQPLNDNYNGGRIVMADGKPYGVVEFADAALMSLADEPEKNYENKLKTLKLNKKKAEKVLKIAKQNRPVGIIKLCDRKFNAVEVLSSPYANAGLYCFDINDAIEAIGSCSSSNAQGEIYLTDTLEWLAKREKVRINVIESPLDMLTYSTKPELREISSHFMRKASDFADKILCGNFDSYFEKLYGKEFDAQKKRYADLLNLFINKYGDKKVVITRSPGRINLMGRHIDHRGGGINVMATDKDTITVAAVRNDDEVHITNIDKKYGDRSFSISMYSSLANHNEWLEYLDTPEIVKSLENSRGDWANYVKSAVLRFQFESETPLCGMDMAFSGEIPAAMGLSSSSSIVVSVAEAVVALNSMNIETDKFITLCGEGEWFVGSRGGAGDHAAMKCGEKGKITHLSFKPFVVGDSASIPDDYCMIVANSMQQAKKSEGSKDIFNERVACYEFALMYLQKHFPQMNFREFRDIAKVRPYSEIYKLLLKLPATVTQDGIKALLPEYEKRIKQIFMTHSFTEVYYLRKVALYGISECARADACLPLLVDGQYEALGEMMKTSHNGDRLKKNFNVTDEDLNKYIHNNQNPALLYGDYACSTEKIDEMCDLLNSVDGVYGSELVGAGLGGCVIALAKKEKADKIIDELNRKYYDKYNLAHSATICMPSPGSGVLY